MWATCKCGKRLDWVANGCPASLLHPVVKTVFHSYCSLIGFLHANKYVRQVFYQFEIHPGSCATFADSLYVLMSYPSIDTRCVMWLESTYLYIHSYYCGGLDGVSAGHLKHTSNRIVPMLAMCFTGLFFRGMLPPSMISVVLVPIVKDKRVANIKLQAYCSSQYNVQVIWENYSQPYFW